MKKHFGFRKLIPCYTEEGRCEECCGDLGVCSLPLLSVYPNAWELARVVLEPARERYGKPMRVLRCFQCHAMVKKLGLDERYATGEVADICAVVGLPRRGRTAEVGSLTEEVPEVTRRENLEIAKAIVEGGVWDVMVLENVGEDDLMPEYVHVSYKREGENRRLVYRRRKDGMTERAAIKWRGNSQRNPALTRRAPWLESEVAMTSLQTEQRRNGMMERWRINR